MLWGMNLQERVIAAMQRTAGHPVSQPGSLQSKPRTPKRGQGGYSSIVEFFYDHKESSLGWVACLETRLSYSALPFFIHPSDALRLSLLSQLPDSNFHLLMCFHFPPWALQYIYRPISTHTSPDFICCSMALQPLNPEPCTCCLHLPAPFSWPIPVTFGFSVTLGWTCYPCQ